jgi:hypothetical protein
MGFYGNAQHLGWDYCTGVTDSIRIVFFFVSDKVFDI